MPRSLPPVIGRWTPAFVVAVVVRITYWVVVIPTWVPMADADQYLLLSRSLADGDGYSLVFPQLVLHPTAFRPPLYPLLLTPGAWLFGDALWPARLLNVVLGSVVVVLAGVLAARIGGRRAGLATALVVALYPPLLANDTVSLTEPLALALMLGAILLVDDERWLGAGAVTGLLLLTRPNGYLVLAILAVWCWQKVDLRRAAGLAVVAVLVLAPWLVRNQIQLGTWRPTTSDGFTMAAMYAQPAQEAGTFVDPVFSTAYDDADHRFAQLDEVVWNDKLTAEAIDGIEDDPTYVLHTVARNIRGFFELSPELNRYPERNDGRDLRLRNRVLPVFYVVSALGVVGLARRWRDRRVVVLAVLTAQFVTLSLLLVAPPRLRAPFDLACCIGLGLLAAEVWPRIQARRSAATASPDGAAQPDRRVPASPGAG